MGFNIGKFLGKVAPVVSLVAPAFGPLGIGVATAVAGTAAALAPRPRAAAVTVNGQPTRPMSLVAGGPTFDGITQAVEGGGINIPVFGTSPVSGGEVADFVLPKDPARRRRREWLIRASINSGVRVTARKLLAAVKLLGIDGTALALNVNRPLAAPFVQPAMVSSIVIDALTRKRRVRCAISRRDISQVRRTARAFASLSADLGGLRSGRGRALPARTRHKVGCACVVCKRR